MTEESSCQDQDPGRALVLFSGGQDFTVCLAWALARYDTVETIGFEYGQRHRVELDVRPAILDAIRARFPVWGAKLGADHMLSLPTIPALGATALTADMDIEIKAAHLPNTFVPGRNLLFFTYAAALAYRRNLPILVGGMCETDYSGYPDCRNETLQTLAGTISLGMDKVFKIETPLMWIDKAGTWGLANDLGASALIEITRDLTHTCYLGIRSRRHDWGVGCGHCPACDLRAKGWAKWQATQAQPPQALT